MEFATGRSVWRAAGFAAGAAAIALTGVMWAGQSGTGATTLAAQMTISPASQTVASDEAVNVDVGVASVNDLNGWEFTIKYNPDVLDYAGVENDTTLISALGPYCAAPIVDETEGTVRVGCLGTKAKTGTAGVSGSGRFATISFDPKAKGTSPLVFTKISLNNPSADDVPASASQGVVRVMGPGESKPSELEPTPTYNPSLLTPTNGLGQPTVDPDTVLDPNRPRATPTPKSGTVRPGTNSSTGGSTNSGAVSNATGGLSGAAARAGANRGIEGFSGQGAGAGSNGSSAGGARGGTSTGAAGENFPVAGSGPGSQDDGWGGSAVAALALTGAALAGAGGIMRRRGAR